MKSKKMAIGTYTKMEFVKPVFKAFQMVELFITTVKAKCNMASRKLMDIGITLILHQEQWRQVFKNYQMVGQFIIIAKVRCSMANKELTVIGTTLILHQEQW